MDHRRLSTADFLAMGMLSRPAPKTEIPEDREHCDVNVEQPSDEALREALEAGKVLSVANCYGITYLWKAGVYRGTLLQYRAVTESPTFDAAEPALEWFRERCDSTDG